MAVSLKHTTQAVGTDAGNGEIRKAQWNEEHTLTAAANTVLGAVSAGAVGEITCTAAGRALLDDADAAEQRTTLAAAGTDAANTFTAAQTITVDDNTNPALKITQTGTAHALVVEDQATDSTAFIVDADGMVGVRVAAPEYPLDVTAPDNVTTTTALAVQNSARNYGLGLGAYQLTNRNVGGVATTVDYTFDIGGAAIFKTNDAERVRISSAGAIGLSGANYGTSGQVLTSNGSGSAPSWQSASSGGAPSVTTYTSGSGSWTIPSTGSVVCVKLWGGGGAGGRNSSGYSIGGGGGGGYTERWYQKSSLGSSGSTISYSVAAGGSGRSTTGTGAPGGNSTFGSGANLVTAYGGGGGGSNGYGGTGGGALGAGVSGDTSDNIQGRQGGTAGGGGSLRIINNSYNVYSRTLFIGPWGGGAGGQVDLATGGSPSYSGQNAFLGGGGGGNASGNAAGGTSVCGGAGGAGVNNGSGVSGSAPAGGGGGSGGGTSGSGGAGRIEVWVW